MEKIRIGDVCDILNGYAFKSENYARSGIRIIRISNVQKGYIEDTTPAFYPIETADLDRFMLEQGDLLVSLTGNVGRVAILGKELLPAALNQRVACLRLKSDKISKNYLFHILNSNFFEQQCIMASNGVAQKNLSTEWLKNYEVPCYERDQQEKIVMVLSTIQSVISGRKHELQKLDDLVKARFVELFGTPISNPMKWDIYQLEECLERIDNGKSFICSDKPRTGDNPAILKLSAATYGDYRPNENKALLDESLFVESSEVHAGDLLFTRKNTPELVGAAAYVQNTPPKLMMPDLIFRLVPNEKVNAVFLWQLINCKEFRPVIQAISGGSAKSMSNISKERLGKIKVICPPRGLQDSLIPFVKRVDKSKAVIQKALDETQLLFDSLMQEYFG